MSITKPYTFQPNAKARANEVNANFDTLYSQANTNISNIEANARDIDDLNDTKAELNGNSTQRFAVADSVNDTDPLLENPISYRKVLPEELVGRWAGIQTRAAYPIRPESKSQAKKNARATARNQRRILLRAEE